MKKITKKIVRKTLSEKLDEAHAAGFKNGYGEGAAHIRREFLPNYQLKTGVNDFVRMVDSWGNMDETSIIMIAGTDLKAHCTGAVPLRLFRALAGELRRLGYSSGPAIS